jgi:hypothetical protein
MALIIPVTPISSRPPKKYPRPQLPDTSLLIKQTRMTTPAIA